MVRTVAELFHSTLQPQLLVTLVLHYLKYLWHWCWQTIHTVLL